MCSSDLFDEAEETRAKVLFNLTPFSKIDEDIILNAFANIDKTENKEKILAYKNWLKNIEQTLDQKLTVEEQKQAKASFYSMVYSS